MHARNIVLCFGILVAGVACAPVTSFETVDESIASSFWKTFDAWAVQTGRANPTYAEWEAAMLLSKQRQEQQQVGSAAPGDLVSRMWALIPTADIDTAKSTKVASKNDARARLAAFWKGCHKWRNCKAGHTYIYGVADNNHIYEVNANRQTARAVLDVSSYVGSKPANGFNAFAYDAPRDTFYFMNSDMNIVAWVRSSGAVGIVAPKQSLGRANPSNAAFYAGSYWFIESTSGQPATNVTLVRVEFGPSTSPGGLPALGVKTTYGVSLKTSDGSPFTVRNGYGDIAVSAAGDLYISPVVLDSAVPDSGPLLVVKDVGSLVAGGGGAQATAVAVAQTGLPGPQLSFDCVGRTLWGQTYDGCQWSTIDTGTGALTPQFTLSLPGAPDPTKCLRDLGGAACTCARSMLG